MSEVTIGSERSSGSMGDGFFGEGIGFGLIVAVGKGGAESNSSSIIGWGE